MTTGKRHLLLNKPIKPSVHSAVKAKSMSLKDSVTLQILHENKLKVSLVFIDKPFLQYSYYTDVFILLKDMEKERSVQRSFDKFKTANYRDVRPIIAEDTSDEDDDDIILNNDEY